MTYPHATGEVSGTLARDVELAKAAVLYADQVDLISLQANMLSQLAMLHGAGLSGVMALINELDDATLRYAGLNTDTFTPEIRSLLPLLGQALEDDDFRAVMPRELQDIYEQMSPIVEQFQETLAGIDADSGARELRLPIDQGLLRLVELERSGTLTVAAIQAAGGSAAVGDDLSSAIWAWTEKVIELLQDPAQRVILDPAAIDLVQSLADSGLLQVSPSSAERSRAAHLGAGFIGRLPAFPDAPFDELLDMRSELSGPLARYRAAVVRMSRSLTASPFEKLIESEADDLWTTDVAPALADIEYGLTDHGLVRELARRTREDARQIVTTGSGLLIGLQQLGHLSATISSAVALGGVGAGVVGRSMNDHHAAGSEAERAELFYLYRLGPGRGVADLLTPLADPPGDAPHPTALCSSTTCVFGRSPGMKVSVTAFILCADSLQVGCNFARESNERCVAGAIGAAIHAREAGDRTRRRGDPIPASR